MSNIESKLYKFDKPITFTDDWTAYLDVETDEVVVESNGETHIAKPAKSKSDNKEN